MLFESVLDVALNDGRAEGAGESASASATIGTDSVAMISEIGLCSLFFVFVRILNLNPNTSKDPKTPKN